MFVVADNVLLAPGSAAERSEADAAPGTAGTMLSVLLEMVSTFKSGWCDCDSDSTESILEKIWRCSVPTPSGEFSRNLFRRFAMPYAAWLGDPWQARHFEHACFPHQYGPSTRAGSDALPRVLRAAAEVDARAKIFSVDAVGAFDHASREAMLGALPARPERSCARSSFLPVNSSPLLCLG